METFAPSFSVSRIEQYGEIHFRASGFWTLDTMVDFQREMIAQAKPLIENGMKIRSLGDLRGFVAQSKDVSDAIRTLVVESEKLGTVRSAVVFDSMLVKMQYARLHETLELETFDNKADALAWLRRPL